MSIPTPPSPLQSRLHTIKAILVGQLLLTLLLSTLFFFWKGWASGLSALLGGAIAFLPELILTLIYFRKTSIRAANYVRAENSVRAVNSVQAANTIRAVNSVRSAKKIVSALFIGEALKWLTTIGLFTVSFQWSKLKPLPLFIVFIAAQLAFWLVPLIYEHCIRVHFTSSRASHRQDKRRDL